MRTRVSLTDCVVVRSRSAWPWALFDGEPQEPDGDSAHIRAWRPENAGYPAWVDCWPDHPLPFPARGLHGPWGESWSRAQQGDYAREPGSRVVGGEAWRVAHFLGSPVLTVRSCRSVELELCCLWCSRLRRAEAPP